MPLSAPPLAPCASGWGAAAPLTPLFSGGRQRYGRAGSFVRWVSLRDKPLYVQVSFCSRARGAGGRGSSVALRAGREFSSCVNTKPFPKQLCHVVPPGGIKIHRVSTHKWMVPMALAVSIVTTRAPVPWIQPHTFGYACICDCILKLFVQEERVHTKET